MLSPERKIGRENHSPIKSFSLSPSSPSAFLLNKFNQIEKEGEESHKNIVNIKASITQINSDGTCTIRLEEENDEHTTRFVTGIFQMGLQYKKGEQVEMKYPGSSIWMTGIINRNHPDGTFSIRYQNGQKEIRLDTTYIRKIPSTLSPSSPTPPSTSLNDNNGNKSDQIPISISDIDTNCSTISELALKLSNNQIDSENLLKKLQNSENITKKGIEISKLQAQQQQQPSQSVFIDSIMKQRKQREELEANKYQEELKHRNNLEKRIQQMKNFKIPSNKEEEQEISHHCHIRHYPRLLFEPFMKSILQANRKRLQRRKATFVLKRFFQHVISWVKVVLAVRILTRNRLAYKKRNRKERAAITIQCAVRKRRAILLSQKRKYSALIIYKILQEKRKKFLKLKQLGEKAQILMAILKIQRKFRWYKNHKLYLINKQIAKENNACKKIQKLFRSKWKRKVFLPELIENLITIVEEPDPNEYMILRKVLKPPLLSCRGYWIEIEDDPTYLDDSNVRMAGREGLIEGVDYDTGMMIVDFGDREHPEEYEVDYNSEHIVTWFKMSTRREQNKIVDAALRLQLWIRRR